MRRNSRGAWAGAAILTVLIPLLALLRPAAPAEPIFPAGPAWQWPRAGSAASAASSLTGTPGAARLPSGTMLLAAWVAASCMALVWLALSQRVIARRRRAWERRELLGTPVLVSPDFGPAVVGVFRPSVVIPAWLTHLPEDSLALVLQHEREHLRCHDSRLLALMLACVVAMPWQPFLWLQLAGLRLAIELDCDRRVLAQGPGVRRYADLLLSLAGRVRGAGWALPLVTLWAPPSRLEKRLRMMSGSPGAGRIGPVAAICGAAIALLLACCAGPPSTTSSQAPGAAAPAALELGYQAESGWERRLAPYFPTPQVRHSPDSMSIYWFVTERDGRVVRHDTGGRDILWRSGEYFRNFMPAMYQRARTEAASAGRPDPAREGFYLMSAGSITRRFPELRDRTVDRSGLGPARFGADSVMVAWAVLAPRLR